MPHTRVLPSRRFQSCINIPGYAMEEAHEKPLRGSECILIVEDEQTLREVAEYVLSKFGYRVLLAVDGESALDLYRKERENISVIVLDVIMTGMGGKRCLKELLLLNPDAKIIVVSGWTDDEPPDVFIQAGAKEFMSKPYDVKNLARVIRKVLDKR